MLDCAHSVARESRSFLLCPALEERRVGEIEAVEKRTAVQRRGLPPFPGLERRPEIVKVAR